MTTFLMHETNLIEKNCINCNDGSSRHLDYDYTRLFYNEYVYSKNYSTVLIFPALILLQGRFK